MRGRITPILKPQSRRLYKAEIQSRLARVEPVEARWAIEDCLLGKISPSIALARMVLATGSAEETEAVLDAVERDWEPPLPQMLTQMARLVRQNRRGCHQISEMLNEHPDPYQRFASTEEGIETCRSFFDRAVRRSEEASVAAWSLGNPKLLEKGTREIVELFERWGLLGPDRKALEIGCGIGRFQIAFSPKLAETHGLDISPEMIEAARRRCAGLPNVFLSVGSGQDLAGYPDQGFDLVFAVDSFPYIHNVGRHLAETHFHEVARVLRPGGDFVIFNFSYRDDTVTDVSEVHFLAALSGFEVETAGEKPFRLWDGVAFRLRRVV
jgi:SAM-dependent methyltransferase